MRTRFEILFMKRTGKWLAQIMHNYKNHCLGYFASETEAAKAYNKKAIELFGEFANVNRIEEM